MPEQGVFTEKLRAIVKQGSQQGNRLSIKEVESFFQQDGLSAEQMELVYEYLRSQKIVVKGYVHTGGKVIEKETPHQLLKESSSFTKEELAFIRQYEQELDVMKKKEEPMASYFTTILEMAKRMHKPGVYLGDLVQEGNAQFMAIYPEYKGNNYAETDLMEEIQNVMEAFLEADEDEKLRDKKMVAKVNDLDQEIKKYSDEMDRKISIEELAEHIHISEDEILDILKLAGEEIKDES